MLVRYVHMRLECDKIDLSLPTMMSGVKCKIYNVTDAIYLYKQQVSSGEQRRQPASRRTREGLQHSKRMSVLTLSLVVLLLYTLQTTNVYSQG